MCDLYRSFNRRCNYMGLVIPGGVPATSTLPNPSVCYSAPGLYDVTLTAGNQYGTASFTKTAYIRADIVHCLKQFHIDHRRCSGTRSHSRVKLSPADHSLHGHGISQVVFLITSSLQINRHIYILKMAL